MLPQNFQLLMYYLLSRQTLQKKKLEHIPRLQSFLCDDGGWFDTKSIEETVIVVYSNSILFTRKKRVSKI